MIALLVLLIADQAAAQYAESPPTTSAGAKTPSSCESRLAKIAVFQSLPVIAGAGECGARDAVLLQSVILPGQANVTLAPPATLRCLMAEQVAQWIRDDVSAAAKRIGAPLRSVDDFDSYECRGQNRIAGAALSEHGRANALDVRGFTLADGRMVELTDVNVAKAWRETLRSSACARFSTVLGPGSDGYHEAHIHLDLAERRSGYRLCQWDVRVPVAQAQPSETPPKQPLAYSSRLAAEGRVMAIEAPIPLPRPRPHSVGRKQIAATGSPLLLVRKLMPGLIERRKREH